MEQGAQFGNYTLISRIGAGGMGEVWKAEDPKLRRTVAIKILPPENATDDESNARFLREARTAAQLYHPNIATIHSIEEHDGRQFIVMEYVEGEPFSKAIATGRLTEGEVAFIGKRVAEALAEAHEHGIVHRDIKPDNIVLSGAKVKVLDFGIAKKYRTGALQSSTGKALTDFRTEAGVILGTIQYMSPEQAMGKALDGRSDIFSLGVVLFEAATGKLPFSGETTTDTLTRILRDDPPDLRVTHPGLSAGITNIIMTCLEKVPDERYQSGSALAEALDAVLGASKTGGRVPAAQHEVDPDALTARATPLEPAVNGTEPDVRPSRPSTVATGPHAPRGAGPWPWIFATVLVAVVSIVGTALYVSRLARSPGSSPPAGQTTPVVEDQQRPGEVMTVRPGEPSPVENDSTAVDDSPGGMTVVELEPGPMPGPADELASPDRPPPPPEAQPGASESGLKQGTVARLRRTNDQEPPLLPLDGESDRAKAEAHLARGFWYFRHNQTDSAVASLELATTYEPRLVRAYVPLGMLALRVSKDDRAEEAFTRIVESGDLAHPREVEIAKFGLVVASGDLERMKEVCRTAPFDGEFGELRRFAKVRGADCDAPEEWQMQSRHQPGKNEPPQRPRRP